MQPTILLLSTCDTKLPETLYLHDLLTTLHSTTPLLLDLSRTPTPHPTITIPSAGYTQLPRSEYITQCTEAAIPLVRDLYQAGKIHGALGIGGSCGTALATGVLRDALPIGVPKVMVSTMASGDVRSFIGETDITMMYSVVDIAGRNAILERVLANAAAMVVGAARYYADNQIEMEAGIGHGNGTGASRKVRVGVTMFGVTTPCVTRLLEYLSQNHGYEVYIFHATGSGGRAMERLIREHQLDAVVDMTTTEIADEVGGGLLSAGPARLEAAANAGIPALVSVGACDMLNFGPVNTLPESFKERLVYRHNPSVTLVRTTEDECRRIGEFIAGKLKGSRPDLTRVILPAGGISMIDVPGMPFHNPDADEVLFSAVERELEGSGIAVLRDQREINNPDFAVSAANSIVDLIQRAALK